ncbi:hypothetical protein B0T17DRAFT_630028 [Bombardia bombarda]|uniref:Uncharacterized protein n=1 Tax=Bombardia bombarda TaxID=252184 RepID=A0AA39TRA5_9PEZI|nr:hypothetical protein B0T17DRAFT_630028 [Bombardia bombarda]
MEQSRRGCGRPAERREIGQGVRDRGSKPRKHTAQSPVLGDCRLVAPLGVQHHWQHVNLGKCSSSIENHETDGIREPNRQTGVDKVGKWRNERQVLPPYPRRVACRCVCPLSSVLRQSTEVSWLLFSRPNHPSVRGLARVGQTSHSQQIRDLISEDIWRRAERATLPSATAFYQWAPTEMHVPDLKRRIVSAWLCQEPTFPNERVSTSRAILCW